MNVVPWALQLALGLAAAPPLPEIRTYTRLESASWEPIALTELAPLVEARAVGPLSRRGVARLVASKAAELAGGDYVLMIEGRFLEDAEAFQVHLAFGPGKAREVPSFHVQETIGLAKATRADVVARIERGAERASERLGALVAPRLEAARLAVEPPPFSGEEPRVVWDPIDAPRVDRPTAALKILVDAAAHDLDRAKALSDVAPDVATQEAARAAIERCVLRDPSPELRGRCVDALGPVARTRVATQRLLLHALREETDPNVSRALGAVSRTFPGLSRREAIETWLWIIADEAASAPAAEAAARHLAEENDVPNLELAVSRCLALDAVAYGKRQPCASILLRKVPEAHRPAVVWRYLERVRTFDGGSSMVFDDVRRALGEHETMRPEVAAKYLEIYLDPTRGSASNRVSYALRKHPAPTRALLVDVLSVAGDPLRAQDAIRLAGEWGSEHPALRPAVIELLQATRAKLPALERPNHGSARKELAETIARLEKQTQREAARQGR
jgi:hypothetical protein